MTGFFVVKDWNKYQHYKNRNPPWIKLQKEVIDSFEWHSLQDASKAIAIVIWMIASEHQDPLSGLVPDNVDKIAFRAHADVLKTNECIKELIRKGFLTREQNAGDLLALCHQSDLPEEEAETEKETEGECGAAKSPPPPRTRAIRIQDWIKTLQKEDPSVGIRCCPDELGEWAQNEYNWDNNFIVQEWGSFCDYWSASNRDDAKKMDWTAAWRRWCEKTIKDQSREGARKWA
jgi:hypothetical protein